MNTVLYHTILNLHTSMLYCLFLFSLTSFLALFSCIQIIKCSFNVGIKSDLIKKNCWGIKGPFVPFTNFSKWNLIQFPRIDIERLLQYTRIIVKRRQYTLLIYVLIFIYDVFKKQHNKFLSNRQTLVEKQCDEYFILW